MQEVTKKKRKKRMRLPNGVGSVHLVGGDKRRRKPWRARVTADVELDMKTGKAKQRYIVIGYFETEAEALAALFEYRKDPYTLEAATCTFADVYEFWSSKKYKEISLSSQRGYIASYKNSVYLHNMKMRDIKTTQLEVALEKSGQSAISQGKMKLLWGQLYKYAIEHDICTKNYAEFLNVGGQDAEPKRTAIPQEHRIKLWEAAEAGDRAAELALIYIYTGWRATELLELPKASVDLEHRIMIGGMKTKAGTNRHVPIHKSIMPFVERLMETPGEMLLQYDKKGTLVKMNYHQLRKTLWEPLMERMGGWDYTPHYCRHTCATLLREANVPEDIRKLILGHSSTDITDHYTHLQDDMLIAAMDTVKTP
jgi:integrase